MALAANHMNGFNKANRRCEDPWFQDVSRCVAGKIYYQRFFFDAPDAVPRMVKYIGPNIDPANPDLVHDFVFHPELLIGGVPFGLGTPEVLDESCLREVPGQEGVGAQPDEMVNEENNGYQPPHGPGGADGREEGDGGGAYMSNNNQAGGKRKRRTNRKRKSRKGKRKSMARRSH